MLIILIILFNISLSTEGSTTKLDILTEFSSQDQAQILQSARLKQVCALNLEKQRPHLYHIVKLKYALKGLLIALMVTVSYYYLFTYQQRRIKNTNSLRITEAQRRQHKILMFGIELTKACVAIAAYKFWKNASQTYSKQKGQCNIQYMKKVLHTI